MATNFFTSTLSVMFRGKDSEGQIQGGPMYVIREALDKRWYPLAVLFSLCCLVGCLPIFQANQLTQIILDMTMTSAELQGATVTVFGYALSVPKLIIGSLLMILSGIVIIGGIKRIGYWAGNMVPMMIVIAPTASSQPLEARKPAITGNGTKRTMLARPRCESSQNVSAHRSVAVEARSEGVRART